ncbi:HxHSH motif-containing lipoprotein [Mycoplasma struthionis]|uniref:Uncharacterized protein n=1 Tax=Mycoplasma struthionis TaxID=538220 RepID=A0A3G8LHG6_9MOLU|nr:hypothetical protein [Mycoplasma struthionis]AZG68787.1 hypothetical protein EGN60_02355 [Mycoplasma struthionis]
MKKRLKFLFLATPFIPLFLNSCAVNHDNEDKEDNLKLRSSVSSNLKTESFDFKNEEVKKVNNFYENDVVKIFNDLKNSYRNYRGIFSSIKRNLDILRNKIFKVANEQGLKEDRDLLLDFYKKYLSEKEEDLKNKALALKLFKYSLIFQDVDAVLVDTNLVFESNEFLENLKIIDQRLNGFDINLAKSQNALEAMWEFLKSHLFNENALTGPSKINSVNLSADKNSHSHSHAIINLVYELGLWHNSLFENIKPEITEFRQEYLEAKKHIIDNYDHIEIDSNFNNLYRVLNLDGNLKGDYNIIDETYRNKAKKVMDEIKKVLLNIAKE